MTTAATPATAATIIPEKLRKNRPNFIFLDLNIDEDFDSKTFLDVIFSFRHNYTLRYLNLVRSEKREGDDRRSTKEIRRLLTEVLKLPRLETLDFEGFEKEELKQFDDLFRRRRTNNKQ
ncbi:expressed unknown protein [Seminavis robusta]|uniref:Uncharacterized protein n=1 Tax=Seminavis robusta TaxID=568900 RepID=A0A9N8F026_9STRA|nr:expressed unknown protein [Seminavis robusta]|eukprot:Sro2098_g314410.1 n/a (119) ;mRNA; r:12463-12819